MSYLARLKKTEKTPPHELPKLPKPPFDSFDSTPSGHISKNAGGTDVHRLIADTLAQIDQARPDWSGWRESLTPEQRKQGQQIEARIDTATLAGDRPALLQALSDYRAHCTGGL
jgi:hypothetical protein